MPKPVRRRSLWRGGLTVLGVIVIVLLALLLLVLVIAESDTPIGVFSGASGRCCLAAMATSL